ncbi:hypothetical protein PLICRDRAFT_72978, partial [Plicaturopsis crispa FD-325 SS-3]
VVSDAIFRLCSPGDVYVLRLVNRMFRNRVDRYSSEVWNMDNFLARWFPSARGFRRQLRRCDALVSGSQPLQFFSRRYYVDSDFDIYIRPVAVGDMGLYLLSVGYEYSPRDGDPDTWDNAA